MVIIDRIHEGIRILNSLGIDKKDIVLIGSGSLAALGIIEEAGDIDFALKTMTYYRLKRLLSEDKVINSTGTLLISSDLQVLKDRYRHFEIYDDEIFSDKFSTPFLEIKIARPELEWAKKISRNKDKDIQHLDQIYRYTSNSKSWDWELLRPVRRINRRTIAKTVFNYLIHHRDKIIPVVKSHIFRRLVTGITNATTFRRMAYQIYDIGYIMQSQYCGGVFTRYDLFIRIIFFNYYRNKEKSYTLGLHPDINELSLYEKMQSLRNSGETTNNRFLKLIQSIETHGVSQTRFPIVTNRTGQLIDGSHRLACNLAEGSNLIRVLRHPITNNRPSDYSRNWFLENNFDYDMIRELDKLCMDYLTRTGAAFTAIVWMPAIGHIEVIKNLLTETGFILLGECEEYSIDSIERFCDDIYARDGIADWKIKLKQRKLIDFENSIVVIRFMVPNPTYRIKRQCSTHLCREVTDRKNKIRDFLSKDCSIDRDIVLHIGDNPEMNREINSALNKYKK